MSSKYFLDLAVDSQVVGLVLAVIFNSVLLFLLVFRANPNFGNYKNLMIIYVAIEMVYSIIGFSTSSGAHSSGSAYVVFRKYNGPNRTIAPIFILQFCTIVYILLLVLGIHYIYRFVAVCHSRHQYLFAGHRLLYWIGGAVVVGLFCSALKYFFLGENELATEFLRDEFWREYGLRMEDIVYNGPIYYLCDKDHNCGSSPMVWITTMVKIVALIACFFLMMAFGYLTYSNLNQSGGRLSLKTLQMQKQLMIVLMIQSGIPIIFMYIPISFMFISPIFGYGIGAYANIMMACIAIYPPLDQLATMYVIRDFRIAIKKALGFGEESTSKISSVGTVNGHVTSATN